MPLSVTGVLLRAARAHRTRQRIVSNHVRPHGVPTLNQAAPTVLTLAGAFGLPQLVNTQLGGAVTNNAAAVVPVPYNNFGIFDFNIADGANKLNALIQSTAPPIIAFGHSLGAAAITQWLRQYGPTCSVSPSNLSFICLGNTMRPYNGFGHNPVVDSIFAPQGQTAWVGVNPITMPSDTPYSVLDIARQYDMFADFPDVVDALSLTNAMVGANTIHPFYQNVSYASCLNGDYPYYVTGNIRYVGVPTAELPMFGIIDVPAVRAQIESDYHRPYSFVGRQLFSAPQPQGRDQFTWPSNL